MITMSDFFWKDFNLDHTLGCGQVFRWDKKDDVWTGVAEGEIIHAIQQKDGSVLIDSHLPAEFFINYFRIDDDLCHILQKINKDPCINKAINDFYGLRLIRQDPWECLISYMLATASSIPTIKKRISNLCSMFGNEITDGYFSFPEPSDIANACISDLQECKLGFRTQRIKNAAEIVNRGNIDLESLQKMEYYDARKKLMSIEGVGEKVADCVLLFSMDKLESFPVDTHIKKIVEYMYCDNTLLQNGKNYHKIGEWGREYFGNYCGYAQEYLYMLKRSGNYQSRYTC